MTFEEMNQHARAILTTPGPITREQYDWVRRLGALMDDNTLEMWQAFNAPTINPTTYVQNEAMMDDKVEIERYILENVLALLRMARRVKVNDDATYLMIPINDAAKVHDLLRENMGLRNDPFIEVKS